jgi:hypothetical protein
LAVGLETIETCKLAVLVAPFLAQLVDVEWMARLQGKTAVRGIGLTIVWVHCDRASLFRRMMLRASPRDRAKLGNWPVYCASIDEQFPRRILRDYFFFDNSDNAGYGLELDRLTDELSQATFES